MSNIYRKTCLSCQKYYQIQEHLSDIWDVLHFCGWILFWIFLLHWKHLIFWERYINELLISRSLAAICKALFKSGFTFQPWKMLSSQYELEKKNHLILERNPSWNFQVERSIVKRTPPWNIWSWKEIHLGRFAPGKKSTYLDKEIHLEWFHLERNPPACFSRVSHFHSQFLAPLPPHQFARLLVEKFKCIHPALARCGCVCNDPEVFCRKASMLLMARTFFRKNILSKSLHAQKHHQRIL